MKQKQSEKFWHCMKQKIEERYGNIVLHIFVYYTFLNWFLHQIKAKQMQKMLEMFEILNYWFKMCFSFALIFPFV